MWLSLRSRLNSFWVKILLDFLLCAGGGGGACVIYLLGGVVEVFVHRPS